MGRLKGTDKMGRMAGGGEGGKPGGKKYKAAVLACFADVRYGSLGGQLWMGGPLWAVRRNASCCCCCRAAQTRPLSFCRLRGYTVSCAPVASAQPPDTHLNDSTHVRPLVTLEHVNHGGLRARSGRSGWERVRACEIRRRQRAGAVGRGRRRWHPSGIGVMLVRRSFAGWCARPPVNCLSAAQPALDRVRPLHGPQRPSPHIGPPSLA